MSLTDALSITLLGMGVVFTGLILTATMIWSFSALPRLFSPSRTHKASRRSEVSGAGGAAVPDEIMAVITTVLEVEKRLYGARPLSQESLGVPEENS